VTITNLAFAMGGWFAAILFRALADLLLAALDRQKKRRRLAAARTTQTDQ
jgi:hypothetical protein